MKNHALFLKASTLYFNCCDNMLLQKAGLHAHQQAAVIKEGVPPRNAALLTLPLLLCIAGAVYMLGPSRGGREGVSGGNPHTPRLLHGASSGPGPLTAAAAERTVSEMIIIASGQRSGSTAMAMGLAEHPCVWSFNEYFNNGNEIAMPPDSDDRRQSGLAHRFLGDKQWKARFKNMWQSLEMVRSRAQIQLDAEHAMHNEPLCGPGGVSIVFKLFDTHTSLPRAKVRELMQHENATVVMLERRAVDRKCSLDHAYAHQDWRTHPDLNHTVNRTACKLLAETDRTKQQALAKFAKRHDEWFQFIREASAEANAALRIEVPFGVWVHKQRSRNVIQSIWEAAGLDAAAGWSVTV